MNEATEIIKILRQAFRIVEPNCKMFFYDADGYIIRFKSIDTGIHWKNSDVFLFGDEDNYICSIWKTMENIVYCFNNNVDKYVWFFHTYPGALRVCQIISESSSSEELKMKLAIAGISR